MMSYIPAAAAARGGRVARRARGASRGGGGGGADGACDAYTRLGVVSAAAGPLFLAGANLEHSTEAEVLLVPGAGDHVLLGLQTEEAPVALALNGTSNAVVFGALAAFWNASQAAPAAVVATRPRPAPRGRFDVAYRLYGVAVPAAASDAALVADSRWSIPAGAGFAGAAAVLNAGA